MQKLHETGREVRDMQQLRGTGRDSKRHSETIRDSKRNAATPWNVKR